MTRDLMRQGRHGKALPFALTYHDEMVGQVDRHRDHLGVGPVGAGGLLDRPSPCGQGDHADRGRPGLRPLPHRDAACTGSRSRSGRRTRRAFGSSRSSGFALVGTAPRYLHINGQWRDHLLFAITAEEVPDGLLRARQTVNRLNPNTPQGSQFSLRFSGDTPRRLPGWRSVRQYRRTCVDRSDLWRDRRRLGGLPCSVGVAASRRGVPKPFDRQVLVGHAGAGASGRGWDRCGSTKCARRAHPQGEELRTDPPRADARATSGTRHPATQQSSRARSGCTPPAGAVRPDGPDHGGRAGVFGGSHALVVGAGAGAAHPGFPGDCPPFRATGQRGVLDGRRGCSRAEHLGCRTAICGARRRRTSRG